MYCVSEVSEVGFHSIHLLGMSFHLRVNLPGLGRPTKSRFLLNAAHPIRILQYFERSPCTVRCIQAAPMMGCVNLSSRKLFPEVTAFDVAGQFSRSM